jgi:hypothetical protein
VIPQFDERLQRSKPVSHAPMSRTYGAFHACVTGPNELGRCRLRVSLCVSTRPGTA